MRAEEVLGGESRSAFREFLDAEALRDVPVDVHNVELLGAPMSFLL
jgi:hypothetical protein